jgi:hypothetical protein
MRQGPDNRQSKVKEFSETLCRQPKSNRALDARLLRLLNALIGRIKLKPKAYCTVLDIAGQGERYYCMQLDGLLHSAAF